MFTVQIRAFTNDRKEILIPALREDGSWQPFFTRARARAYLRKWAKQVVAVEGGTLNGVIFCPTTGAREEMSFHCHI